MHPSRLPGHQHMHRFCSLAQLGAHLAALHLMVCRFVRAASVIGSTSHTKCGLSSRCRHACRELCMGEAWHAVGRDQAWTHFHGSGALHAWCRLQASQACGGLARRHSDASCTVAKLLISRAPALARIGRWCREPLPCSALHIELSVSLACTLSCASERSALETPPAADDVIISWKGHSRESLSAPKHSVTCIPVVGGNPSIIRGTGRWLQQ